MAMLLALIHPEEQLFFWSRNSQNLEESHCASERIVLGDIYEYRPHH